MRPDAICRLSTGGGLGKRELYTDGDEYLLDAQRPIILNGIAEIATRGDLLDRALMVELPVIPDAARVDEESFWQRFEQAQPKIFGALLDAAASALDRLPSVKLAQAPRMADFARLIVAAEPGLGWEPGSFLMAYRRSRGDIHETAIESSIVGPLIRTIAEAGFDDTATVLLQHVNDLATDADRRSKDWPANVEALTARVKRLAPDLRRLGYTVEHGRRTVNGRTRRIWTLGARG